MIQPIEKKNVADEVFEKMLNMIIEGDWKKGEMIPSPKARGVFRYAFSGSSQSFIRWSSMS